MANFRFTSELEYSSGFGLVCSAAIQMAGVGCEVMRPFARASCSFGSVGRM